MHKILNYWLSQGKLYALQADCQYMTLKRNEHFKMFEVYYNSAGIWSLEILTSDEFSLAKSLGSHEGGLVDKEGLEKDVLTFGE